MWAPAAAEVAAFGTRIGCSGCMTGRVVVELSNLQIPEKSQSPGDLKSEGGGSLGLFNAKGKLVGIFRAGSYGGQIDIRTNIGQGVADLMAVPGGSLLGLSNGDGDPFAHITNMFINKDPFWSSYKQ